MSENGLLIAAIVLIGISIAVLSIRGGMAMCEAHFEVGNYAKVK